MFKSGNYPYWYNKCLRNGQWSKIDTALECEGMTVDLPYLWVFTTSQLNPKQSKVTNNNKLNRLATYI